MAAVPREAASNYNTRAAAITCALSFNYRLIIRIYTRTYGAKERETDRQKKKERRTYRNIIVIYFIIYTMNVIFTRRLLFFIISIIILHHCCVVISYFLPSRHVRHDARHRSTCFRIHSTTTMIIIFVLCLCST